MDERTDSENRFRELVEQSSDWIWEVDENAVYTYSSPSVLQILCYEPFEVLGKTPFDLMPPDEVERVASVFSGLLKSRKPIRNFENINLRKDGKRVVLETSGVPVFDMQGKFCGYRGMDTDITERKEAEEALRRIGGCLAEAQRIAHLASWDWNVRENRLSWSDEMYRISGIDPDQFGASFEAFIEAVHPEDREKVRKAVVEALSGGGYDIEFRLVRPAGEERIVHAQGEVSFGDDGKPSTMLGTILDITERKETENELRLFRTLLDNSSDAIEVIDPDSFRFLDMNMKGCRDLGYNLEEILGMRLWEIDREFDQAGKERVGGMIEKTGKAVIESRHWRKDGSVFPVEVSLKRVDLDKSYMIAVVRDISERKRIEQELKHSNEQLRQLAATDMLTGVASTKCWSMSFPRRNDMARYFRSSCTIWIISSRSTTDSDMTLETECSGQSLPSSTAISGRQTCMPAGEARNS